MKVAVYGIAKNEEKNAAAWAKCAEDADYRVVTDTGSTDATCEVLRAQGVVIHHAEVRPWRFDVARNISLSHVPEDIDVCISLDLDERLMPGWRAALEKAWNPETTLLRYPAVQKWKPDGVTPEMIIYGHKIHSRHDYHWHYALHELLRPSGDRHVEGVCHDIWINQYQDEKRDRSFYFEMLNRLVVEEPQESRYSYYRVLELANRDRFAEAIAEAERYMSMDSVRDPTERAFVLRALAWAQKSAGLSPEIYITTFFRAAAESPGEREPWVSLALEMRSQGNWPNAFAASVNALKIRSSVGGFRIEPNSWNGLAESIFLESGSILGIPESELKRIQSGLSPSQEPIVTPMSRFFEKRAEWNQA